MTDLRHDIDTLLNMVRFSTPSARNLELQVDPPTEYESSTQEDFRRAREAFVRAAMSVRIDLTLHESKRGDWGYELQADLQPGALCSDAVEDLLMLVDSMLAERITATGRACSLVARIQKRISTGT